MTGFTNAEPAANRHRIRSAQALHYARRPSAIEVGMVCAFVVAVFVVSLWPRYRWLAPMMGERGLVEALRVEDPDIFPWAAYPESGLPHVKGLTTSVLTLETMVATALDLSPRTLAALRLACHCATSLFLGLASLCMVRRWAMPPRPAVLLSVVSGAVMVWMPGAMRYHLQLWSSPAFAVMCFAALLWVDMVLDSRRRDLPVVWMAIETLVLIVGAWTGPFFWIVAAVVLFRRLITARWHHAYSAAIGVTMTLVPVAMGAAAHLSTARMLSSWVAPRALRPTSWVAWMLDAYGWLGVAALFIGAVAVAVGLCAGMVQAVRWRRLGGPVWSVSTLGAAIAAAPIVVVLITRTHSSGWPVDTLYFAPSVAFVPFAIAPLMLWLALPSSTRRWPSAIAWITIALASAMLLVEGTRFRDMMPRDGDRSTGAQADRAEE